MSRDLSENWRCNADDLAEEAIHKSANPANTKNLQDGKLRRYEIAIACTSEYTAYHDDGNNANGDARADALAAMVITVARVNTVYEQDLAMTFQLVPRNDELIYFNGFSTGPNANADPYDNYDGGQMLNANTGNINGRIGSGNYDIGHVFSTGGGGIAGQSPCGDFGSKGAGVTGIVTPEFDPFDIDYVSHEIGHQFGAGHTYYNACFGSKVAEDYEPGSASTIMGYAGICFPNVQENSDAYFHATSIARITASASGDTCEQEINISNTEPTAVAGANYTIPKSTPFILDATGTFDPDGDILTYCWEQFDNDGSFPQPPQATNAGGPIFRTLFPTTDPTRTFPNLEAVINNETPTWEVLPSVGRSIDFRLTVRDNNPLGGQTDQDNMVVNVSNTQGPFVVTYPNAASITWYAGNTETVTWDVNGTNGLSPNVNILLSTDGGYTYPVTLASNVPNDGIQNITVPLEVGTSNRIKIEAASNIFFDLSNQDFEIKAGTWEFATGAPIQNVCQGGTATYSINFTPAVGYSENVTSSASGNPAGTSVSFSPTSSSAATLVTMTISNTAAVPVGSYPITITGTSSPNGDVETIATTFNVYDNTIGDVVQATPANGAINQPTTATFSWNELVTAASYTIQIADSNTFTNVVESATVFNVNEYQASTLSPGETYYWRVRPSNPCVIGNFNSVFSFQTADDVCITYENEYFENNDNTWEAAGTNAVSARVDIPDNIIINDVNFYMRANHGNINHIKMQFSSPEGRFAEIYNRDCSGSNFDVTFSDAGTPLTCGNVDPATNAGLEGVQQASQLFTRFHGENAQGTWVLLATERTNGTGGTFNEFNVTVCGEFQIATDIVILENNLLNVNTGQTATITNSLLRASQPGASNTQLVYTVNNIPEDGTINLSGTPLTIGQTFTQRNINLGNVTYTNNGTTGGNDNFTFTVNGINSDELSGQVFNILAPQVSAPPVANCMDITIDLGASGVVTITPSDIDNGSTDDIAIENYSLDVDTFTCDDLGTPQVVTLTVTDGEGQAASCTATVTLTHNTPPANLSVSGITDTTATVMWDDAGADSYEVRFRESGTTPWTTLTGIASTSTNLTGLTSETQYDVQVRAECNGDFTSFSATVIFTTLETILNYCSANGDSVADEYIGNVSIGTIDNPSNAMQSTGGYSDYTILVAPTDLTIGTIPTISVDKVWTTTEYDEAVSVWIDYNKDGDFDEANERVITNGGSRDDLVNEPFDNAIPVSALTGNTRMRVIMRYVAGTNSGTTYTQPCGNFNFGEVEDYTVTIVAAGDTTNPTITCNANRTIEGCDGETVTLATPTTSDDVAVDTVTNDAPATFPLGTTTVTWTVTDTSGNTATCQQNITIQDTTNPTISCPANLVTDTDAGIDTATVTYTAPVGTDNCSATTIQTEGLTSGSDFPIGTTTNTFTVTDPSGNSVSCSFTVTVNDANAPDITCPADVSAFTDSDSCNASSVTLGTATSTDATATITSDAPATFPLGTTTVTWAATDTAGNSSTCTQSVTVTDNVNPMIACPSNITTDTDSGMDTATVTFTAPVGTDNCSATTTQTEGLASGSEFPIGTTTNTFTVTDPSGNSVSCSFTVTVNSNSTLDIYCPEDIVEAAEDQSCDNANVILGTATSSDPNASITNDAPAIFNIGDTSVTWTATDANGNEVSCTQIVTILDITPPEINCPVDYSVDPNEEGEYLLENFSDLVSDNCTPWEQMDIIQTPLPGTVLQAETSTIVTLSTQDASGNTALCSFEMSIRESLDVDSFNLGAVNIYPVPTKGKLTISHTQHTLQSAQMFDMRGRLVKTVQLSNTVNSFDIDDLSDAVYLVRIHFTEGTIMKRVIKSADQK